MAKQARFTVLVGTDGSAHARAAVRAAGVFPWPRGARASIVVARDAAPARRRPEVMQAVNRMRDSAAVRARRLLARRFPDVQVLVSDRAPADAILAEARRVGARAIVVGSRGHTGLSRLWLGSVSRHVVGHARCPVLVVKERLRDAPRILVGLDGSLNSRRVVAFLASLEPPAQARVTLVSVVEPVRAPSLAMLPAAVRTVLVSEVRALQAGRVRAARRAVEVAAQKLKRAGWRVRTEVRMGLPLSELLAAAQARGANVVAVGARGVGAIERLLLGSVAEGVLSRSSRSVLVVR